MRPFILQDWITIKSTGQPPAPAGPNFVQDSAGWLDLGAFQDVVIWFDLRQTTRPGAGSLTWHFQTAPTKDNALFFPNNTSMATTGPFGTISSPILQVIPVTLAGAISGGGQPLARWLRWMIEPTVDAAWSATFRVIVAANQVTAANVDVGPSTALASNLAVATTIAKQQQQPSTSGVLTVLQPTVPISLGQGPSQQSLVSVVQPTSSINGNPSTSGVARTA